MNKKILLIITGSVAAYRALDLLRELQRRGFLVSVILTRAAEEFVTRLSVAALCEGRVFGELFDDGRDGMAHIDLSREADLVVVAPASADFLAKMAWGRGDDLASTAVLACDKPILVAPAMNKEMWKNAANLRNVEFLRGSGVIFAGPVSGKLACGEVGEGKMCEISEVLDGIEGFFEEKDALEGKKILITAGGTREFIDPVRFVGNESSGKQGIYLAEALVAMGAEVFLVAANISLPIALDNDHILRVKTAQEMFLAVKERLGEVDGFIGCAAVGDFYVKNASEEKIKKDGDGGLRLDLAQNVDILEHVGNCQERPALVIGFAAESSGLIENAQKKLRRKNCDLVVANDVDGGAVFGGEESRVVLVSDKVEELGVVTKREVARRVAGFCRDFLC